MGGLSDQNFQQVSRLGSAGFERNSFLLQKSRACELRGLVQHVACPLGGNRVVDRWCSNECPKKGRSR
jgi:hypothetical protein